MNKLPPAIWLKSFEAAARHGSFSRAAKELNLTPAAVSKQIRLLEEKLNTKLFRRQARGVELTDIGQAYAQPIRKSFSEIELATNNLFSPGVKQTIRVRASISYAALVLAPMLQSFYRHHPSIHVELTTSVWADRMDGELIDVDIRYGNGDWRDGHDYHLGHEYAAIYCHPKYACELGESITIESLAESKIVQVIGYEFEWERLANHYSLNFSSPQSWIKVDSSLIAMQVVIAGAGATIVLECFAKFYLEQDLVVKPVDIRLPVRQSHYLVINKESKHINEVNIFSKWLSSQVIDIDSAPTIGLSDEFEKA